MAGWSIAQNPLLLPRDQPCNVLGNFCNGLTYCQQRNLSGFYIKTRVCLTRLHMQVKSARCLQTWHIMQEEKNWFIIKPVEHFLCAENNRATYSPCAFHGGSCWTGLVLACCTVGHILHVVSTEHNVSECKIHDIVSLFVSAFTAALNICDSTRNGNGWP